MPGVVRETWQGDKTPAFLKGFGGRKFIRSLVLLAASVPRFLGNEVQTVTITGGPTGGTFTLNFRGQITTALAFNATGATVQTALEALTTIKTGNVTVTGGAGGPYTVTFVNELGGIAVPNLVAVSALTGGTTPAVTVVEVTAGDSFHAGRRRFSAGWILTKVPGDPTKVRRYTGISEVQTVTITGAPTGGTFNLAFRRQVTAAIAFNATGATVQAALEALSTVGAGNVTVTGAAGGPYTVTFAGDLAGQDVDAIVLQTNGLTGGTAPTVTVVPVNGEEPFAILGRDDNVMGIGSEADVDVPGYADTCVFDSTLIIDYGLHKTALERSYHFRNCKFDPR